MHNFLKLILGLGAFAAVHAVPVTFTDEVDGSNGKLTQGQTYNFTHDINDNGFNSSTDVITSADIYISLADDFDFTQEKIKIKIDNITIANNMEVDYAAYHFLVASSMLQADGLLNVSLNVVSGDFFFQGSRLDVDAARTTPAAVPEPTTWAMMGMGLLVMGVMARRKRV